MNYTHKIDLLKDYIQKHFTDPELGWSDEKIIKRSVEQEVSENVLLDCLDNVTYDPVDILFDRCLFYEWSMSELDDTSPRMKFAKYARQTVDVLINYMKNV